MMCLTLQAKANSLTLYPLTGPLAMRFRTTTPVMLAAGYIDWVAPWRLADGQPVRMYGEDWNAPYSPVIIEVVS